MTTRRGIRTADTPRGTRPVLLLAALLATTLLTGCASDYVSSERARTPSESVETAARQATLRVRAIGCTTAEFGSGSAFALDRDTLVTNRHVAQNTRRLQVTTWDGRDYEIKVGSVSYVNDLAVLEVDGTLGETLDVGSAVSEGQTVYAVGYPLGGAWTMTVGEVHDIVDGEEYEETGDVIRMTAAIEPGNSGGPLLDEEGRLVGVVFAIDTLNGLGLAISAEQLGALADASTQVGTSRAC